MRQTGAAGAWDDAEVDERRDEFRFTGSVVQGFRNWVGIWVPPSVTRRLETKAQVAVAGHVNGIPFHGSIVPTGRGHFMCVNRAFRHANQIEPGQRVVVAVAPVSKRPAVEMPPELEAALKRDPEGRKWWDDLSESKHRIAMTWIGQARNAEVRNYRVSDVLRRARRAYLKEGPFYPTKEDQPLLTRPKPPTGSAGHANRPR